jgi:hypothetical protein
MFKGDSIVKDGLTVSFDTLQPVKTAVKDTSIISVVGTSSVSVVDMPKEQGPSAWLQLLIAIIVPLIVVYVDKLFSRHYQRKDEEDKHKHYRTTVLDWIEKIQPIERTFQDSIQSLSKSIGDSDDMLPQAYAMPLTLHDKLSEMTVEKMTDAFLKDFKNDKDKRYVHMYNILSNFEYLSKITNGVKESYDTYNKQAFALCKEWNALYDDLMVYFNRLPNINVYSTIITGWMMELMQKPNSVAVHEKYLNLLNLTSVKEKDVDTFTRTNKLHRIIVQVQAINTGFAKNFSDMASNIDLSLNSLNEAVKYFRENEK